MSPWGHAVDAAVDAAAAVAAAVAGGSVDYLHHH